MARPYTGKIAQSTEERVQKNGDIYVYQVQRWYDPDTRNTRRKLELLGIKDPSSGEVKGTRPKRKQSANVPAITPVVTEITANGMISIVRHFSEAAGVTDEVMAALPKDEGNAMKLLTLSWYAFATDGGTWTRAIKWTSDYLPLLPYKYGAISKSMYTNLFHYIGENSGIKWSIFKSRAGEFGEGELIAWDSTVYECYVKDVHDSVQGVTKDGLVRYVYKVLFFYSITSRKLISFEKLPGNVADCTTVPYAISMMKALGLKKPEILQDNGYTDDNTIGELLHQKFHFVTRILPSTRWIRDDLNRYRAALMAGTAPAKMVYSDAEFSGVSFRVKHTFSYVRAYKSTKKGIEAGDREPIEAYVNVFVYYSTYKKGLDDRAFRTQFTDIRSDILAGSNLDNESRTFRDQYMSLKYDDSGNIIEVKPIQKEIDARFKNHGFLVLITDHEKDMEKALQKFRTREKIEERIKCPATDCRDQKCQIISGTGDNTEGTNHYERRAFIAVTTRGDHHEGSCIEKTKPHRYGFVFFNLQVFIAQRSSFQSFARGIIAIISGFLALQACPAASLSTASTAEMRVLIRSMVCWLPTPPMLM